MDRAAPKIWTSRSLPGVECFRAHALVHHYQRHSHESYAIGVIEDGIGGNSYRGSTHRHPPGTIVAMNPDEAHTGYAVDNKPLSYRMFMSRLRRCATWLLAAAWRALVTLRSRIANVRGSFWISTAVVRHLTMSSFWNPGSRRCSAN